MNEEEISEQINEFIENYFKEINQISKFHLDFFHSNLISTTDINMLSLKEIIFRGLNFLQDVDDKFLSKLLRKMYFDIKALIKFLNNFEKNSKITNHIFEHQFLPFFKPYKDLEDKISENRMRATTQRTLMLAIENELKFLKPKTKAEISEYNRLRGKDVDAIHRYSKAKDDIIKFTTNAKMLKDKIRNEFNRKFEKRKKSEIYNFKLVINSKLFYFNKLIWIEASKNHTITKYFLNMGIKNINLNIYAKNYLKQINNLKSNKHIEKLEEIENALRELNK